MNFFERIKALLSPRKKYSAGLNIAQVMSLMGGGVNASYSYFLQNGYKRNSIVATCIKEIYDACSLVKFVLTIDGEIPETTTPAMDELMRLIERPNERKSYGDFIRDWIIRSLRWRILPVRPSERNP